MQRVREAAGGGLSPATGANAPPPSESDIGRLMVAQGRWNEGVAESLTSIVRCLQSLQAEIAHLGSRLESLTPPDRPAAEAATARGIRVQASTPPTGGGASRPRPPRSANRPRAGD